jgi:DNA polymerase-3 subunit beta
MQTQFHIPRAAVRALLQLAASKDIRYYLNGMLCEVSERQTVMVATNGHMMGAYRHELSTDRNECGAPLAIIIPRDALESIGAKGAPLLIVRARDDGRYDLCDLSADTVRTFAAVDGKFPDWRRVMPRGPVGASAEDLPFAQFDPQYVQAFAKAAKAFGCRYGSALKIGHRGQSSACIEISGHPGFFGVLMPLRTNRADVPMQAPDWCTEPMPTAPAAETGAEAAAAVEAANDAAISGAELERACGIADAGEVREAA